jgi:hypothetical protein
MGTQGTESGNELVVDCMCIVDESANDALDYFDGFCGEKMAVGFFLGEVDGLDINYFAMLVRRELVLDWHGMLVLGADIEDISWHRDVGSC